MLSYLDFAIIEIVCQGQREGHLKVRVIWQLRSGPDHLHIQKVKNKILFMWTYKHNTLSDISKEFHDQY